MSESLTYIDHDGIEQIVEGCETYTDKAGRHWMHCSVTGTNLASKERSREDMLLSALNSALWYVKHYKDDRDSLREFKNKFAMFVDSVSDKED
jgi:hypothetical protein